MTPLPAAAREHTDGQTVYNRGGLEACRRVVVAWGIIVMPAVTLFLTDNRHGGLVVKASAS